MNNLNKIIEDLSKSFKDNYLGMKNNEYNLIELKNSYMAYLSKLSDLGMAVKESYGVKVVKLPRKLKKKYKKEGKICLDVRFTKLDNIPEIVIEIYI